MSSIEERRVKKRVIACSALLAGLLGGCVGSTRLDPDFGDAVRQDAAAQVADPDGVGRRASASAADGARTALAQDRYQKNQVIPPVVSTTTSTRSAGGSNGSGASGSGGGN